MTYLSTGPNLRRDGVLLVLLVLFYLVTAAAVSLAYFHRIPKSATEWAIVVLTGPLGSIAFVILVGLGAAAMRAFRRNGGS